ncbi:MAG: hypothetical protein COB30_003240 [Ectothiorhodospiraceae bacterium]|nr:hypothetical protein [Ectothiorhodospiraceae bacterium]
MIKNIFILLLSMGSILIFQSCALQGKNGNMRVVSIKKVVNENTPGYEICSSFTLEKKDIVKYFTLAEQVDGREFHSEAIILPCKYQGSININGSLLQWEVVAGGAGYLYNDKKINKQYLCKKNCCKIFQNLC